MIKYTSYSVVFQEIPGEVTLALNISSCPHRCPGCHSPELQTDIGEELTEEVLLSLLARYEKHITCVCFMGEGQDDEQLALLCRTVVQAGYECALYTGSNLAPPEVFEHLSYIKYGPYVEELGGLSSPTTNQRLYRIIRHAPDDEDIDFDFLLLLPKQGEPT